MPAGGFGAIRPTDDEKHLRGRLGLLLPAVCLAFLATAILSFAPRAMGSSYGGTGDWVIPGNVTELVTGESINVSGNVTVVGSLTLVNSSVVVDRNITISGVFNLNNTTITFTVDGPGTNFITAGASAIVNISDFDGDLATTGDQSVLRAVAGSANLTVAAAFNSTFTGSRLTIANSRVEGAGWRNPTAVAAGFRVTGGTLSVSGTQFRSGYEAFIVTGTDGVRFLNSSFDGVVSAVNLTGGSKHFFEGILLVNHTFGLRITSAVSVWVDGLFGGPTAAVAYAPPGAPALGTAVDVERCVNVTLNNVTILGLPSAPPPRLVTGFAVGNSTAVNISFFSGRTGDSPGRVVDSADVSLYAVLAARFDQPLDIAFCSNVTVTGFSGTDERSGLRLTNVTNVTLLQLTASGLLAPAAEGVNLRGSLVVRDVAVVDSLGAIELAGDPLAPSFYNVSADNVTFGIRLSAQAASNVSLDRLNLTRVLLNAVDLQFASVSRFTVTNLSSDGVGGRVLNFSSGSADVLTLLHWATNDSGAGVALLNASSVGNLSAADLSANALAGPLLEVDAAQKEDFDLRDLATTNSTGSLVYLAGGGATRVRLENMSLLAADQVPPAAQPAAITIDTTAASGGGSLYRADEIEVSGLTANVSSRGGVYLACDAGGSVRIENLSLAGLQFEGVRVVSSNATWALVIANLSYTESGSAAVWLEGVQGGDIRGIVADAPIGVQLDATSGASVGNLAHNGSFASVLVTSSQSVIVDGVNATSGFGVEANDCRDLLLANLTLAAGAWAVRATLSSNITVTGLAASNSSGGLALRGVTGARVTLPVIEFTTSGIQIVQASSNVTIVGPALSTPPSVSAGTMLQVAYSASVRVSDLAFAGSCQRAGFVQSSTDVRLDGFDARSCGEGLEVQGSRAVRATRLTVPGAFAGSALIVSGSRDVQVTGGDLRNASSSGIIITGVDGASFAGLDASGAGGEGALIAFATNLSLDGMNLDGAGGLCLRVLYSGRNVTLTRLSASRGLAGVELLSSSNVTVSGVNASFNGGTGVYTDPLSFDDELRNITAIGNLWNGVLVSVNRTRLIDGNFTDNGQPGISVAPLVRLDWTVEGFASLTDESIDLTGDLVVQPGASLAVTRSNVTIEQTVRLRALEPYARVVVGAGASLTLDHASLAPRDGRVPYGIDIGTGAAVALLYSSLSGGAKGDATSSLNATGAAIFGVWADLAGWHAPLQATGGTFDCRDCVFTRNARGPSFAGGVVSLLNFSSNQEDGDGLTATAGAAFDGRAVSVSFNGGNGAVFDAVDPLHLADFDAVGNLLAGVRVSGSALNASSLSIVDSGGVGLEISGGAAAAVAGLTLRGNAGAGADVQGTADVVLALVEVRNNTGTGLLLHGLPRAAVSGGTVAGNGAFGVQATDVGTFTVEGTTFSDDATASLRIEGSGAFSVGNSSITTKADHAVQVLGTVGGLLVDVVLSGNLTGLLAGDSTRVFVLNSSMKAPNVLAAAVVTIGWYLRVLVQAPDGYPAAGADVTVWNATGALAARAATGPGGATALLAIAERSIFADGSQVVFGPERVNASHPSLGRAHAEVNVTRYTALGLKLDNGTPSSSPTLEGPAGQGGWFLGSVLVSLRAADDRSDGLSLYYRAGPGPWQVAASDVGSVTATLAVASEGTTTVEFYAVDAAGNAEPVQALLVRIDLHRPTAAFVELGTSVVYSGALPLAWSGSDGGGSGVDSFLIEYAFEGSSFAVWLAATTNTSGTFAALDGSYTFHVTAFDRAGQASFPASLSVRVALVGALRFTVVAEGGGRVPSVEVTVVGSSVRTNGSGEFDLRDLAAGPLTLRFEAPGFDPVERNVTVVAGETTDLGNITMHARTGPPGGFDLTAGYLALGGLVLITLAYYVRMRTKWERRRRARQDEADALKKKP